MPNRELAKLYGIDLPDCGDSSCVFGSDTGQRTNGGCRCYTGPSKDTHKLRVGIIQLQRLAMLIYETS